MGPPSKNASTAAAGSNSQQRHNNSQPVPDFSCINPQGRDELVGKRFLLVPASNSKLKLSRISEWNWKAGVIRCASHTDIKDSELQV